MFWQRLKTLLLLLSCACVTPHPAQAQFNGGFGPTPTPRPQQTLEQMAEDFRALGFVDPQNLPYHNVEVVLGEDTIGLSAPRVIPTRGWILPKKKNQPRSFVGWNGWVYQAYSVGDKADWRSDARSLLERAARHYPLNPYKQPWPPKKTIMWPYETNISDDRVSTAYDALIPLKAVMFEIMGEKDLAQKTVDIYKKWARRTKDKNSPPSITEFKETVTRFEFVEHWIWPGINLVQRSIRRGEDRTALETLRILSHALEMLGEDADSQPAKFLIHKLLVDQERRSTEKVIPSDRSSTEFLVWDLQNDGLVPLVQRGKRLSVDRKNLLRERVRTIVARGDEAVEPLLQALANDHRLTRSFDWDWHGLSSYPYSIPVSDLVLRALEGILQTDLLYPLSLIEDEIRLKNSGSGLRREGLPVEEIEALARVQLATHIRTDWEKLRAVPAADRPYFILQDDNAGTQKWLEAARTLASDQLYSFNVPNGAYVGRPLNGELLRSKKNPTVSELLARRSNELMTKEPYGPTASAELALLRNRWDATGST